MLERHFARFAVTGRTVTVPSAMAGQFGRIDPGQPYPHASAIDRIAVHDMG
jgi:hypothetical protein